MKNMEQNPRFTNPLIKSASPYLRQHAHNPVYWYPWGKEALDLARAENKPILLSIGYSTCYWCHVMERDVFENLSIAAQMNRTCVNIKIDREEDPHLDEIYMVARQLLTHQGGWPNNVFLTPDLKPFYAGGTFAADESYGKPGFPKILEWVDHVWHQQRPEIDRISAQITEDMRRFLIPQQKPEGDVSAATLQPQVDSVLTFMEQQFDSRAGGFFNAPKFPHEPYLAFLLQYYQQTRDPKALDMVTLSLGRMAAGGLYDHVGCGFHRYSVDKEWFVPHFEKMLYNQSQMARIYTDAARLTGSEYFADIAQSVLDFVSGPMTSAHGAFYAAIDAETDGIEGAFYAWSAKELNEILSEEEIMLLTSVYGVADIPNFPGHKHVDGQVILARKPLDILARDTNTPYIQVAAVCAELMNKLLTVRNQRQPPVMDDKIITSWNGLMIDAFAHAGKVFQRPGYIASAQEAADFILEHMIDNDGQLYRIYAGGKRSHTATLEDYAYLIKGLLSLQSVSASDDTRNAIISLMQQCKDRLWDKEQGGFFAVPAGDDILYQPKNAEDNATPSPNGVMLENLYGIHALTGDTQWLNDAQALARCFLRGKADVNAEYATILAAAMTQYDIEARVAISEPLPELFDAEAKNRRYADDALRVQLELEPKTPEAGTTCKIIAHVTIADGWHINTDSPAMRDLIPTQLDVQGKGVEVLKVDYPPASRAESGTGFWEGKIILSAEVKLPASGQRQPLAVRLRFQPCHAQSCHMPRDIVLTV